MWKRDVFGSIIHVFYDTYFVFSWAFAVVAEEAGVRAFRGGVINVGGKFLAVRVNWNFKKGDFIKISFCYDYYSSMYQTYIVDLMYVLKILFF